MNLEELLKNKQESNTILLDYCNKVKRYNSKCNYNAMNDIYNVAFCDIKAFYKELYKCSRTSLENFNFQDDQ